MQFRKLCSHSRVVCGQSLDAQILRLFVGKAQIVFRGEQRIFGFLQMENGFVYLINGGLKTLAGQSEIASKFLFDVLLSTT